MSFQNTRKSLLELAKESESRTGVGLHYSDDEVELAIAYLKGEVSQRQVKAALGVPSFSASWALSRLKYGYNRGLLKNLLDS